jgi:hypothetical protein
MNDESENLHWHALNYRTAAPQHADEMWQELVACVERKIAAERERCALLCDKAARNNAETTARLRWPLEALAERIRGPNV